MKVKTPEWIPPAKGGIRHGMNFPGSRGPLTGKHITKSIFDPLETRTNKRKAIDWRMVWKLAHGGSTAAEIASYLDVTEQTLRSYKEFFKIYKSGYNTCNMSLRRRQVRAALGGNTAILIWLGKNRLGQKDNITLAGDPNAPLEINSNAPDLKRLTDEELKALLKLTAKAEGQTLDADFETVPQLKLNGKVNGRSKNGKVKGESK